MRGNFVTTRPSANPGSAEARLVRTVEQYPNKAAARQAVAALLLKLNSEVPHAGPVTFATLVDRYVEDELPERFSTRISYLSLVNTHIRPKWADLPLDKVKTDGG